MQQRKFKKYNNFKYRRKSTNQTRVQEEQEDLPHNKNGKTLYSDILKRKRSKTDIERKSSKTKISTTTQHKTTIQQLEALNIKTTRENRHHDLIRLRIKARRNDLRDKSNICKKN